MQQLKKFLSLLFMGLFVAVSGCGSEEADNQANTVTVTPEVHTVETGEGSTSSSGSESASVTHGEDAHAAESTQHTENVSSGSTETSSSGSGEIVYHFRKNVYLNEHFAKHGDEFPYATAEDYLAGANEVIQNPDALTKTEKEDGDAVYYVEATNEFVILSKDGYIRTYFKPTDGLAYYNRQ